MFIPAWIIHTDLNDKIKNGIKQIIKYTRCLVEIERDQNKQWDAWQHTTTATIVEIQITAINVVKMMSQGHYLYVFQSKH